jgi:hypothetical protein
MFEQPRTGQELMTPQQITDICEGRDQTVAMWLDLYDHYHATRDAAGRLSIAGTLALTTSGDRYEDKLTKAFITAEPLRKADRETGKITETPARENFTTVLTQTVDRRCWRALMDQLGFDQLLDEQARREFHDGLRDAPAASPSRTAPPRSAISGGTAANSTCAALPTSLPSWTAAFARTMVSRSVRASSSTGP